MPVSRRIAKPPAAAASRSEAPRPPAATTGEIARQRLLMAALALFSEKGFAKTSTREIAQAAGANVAAIRYYFGDKAGLYRAVYVEPLGSPHEDIPRYLQPHFTLRQSLEGFFDSFLEPMKQGNLVQQCMRLHFREMLEPTGLWAEELEHGIKPAHAALVSVLCRHLGLRSADDELHRLAFAIASLALQMFICRDVITAVRPQLVAGPAAIDKAVARLTGYALALVEAEAQQRRTAPAKKKLEKL